VSLLDSFIVLGGGSNMIFGDEPVETPVIKLGKGFGNIDHQEGILTVGASVSTSALLGYCLRNALSGLEFLSGIPGTIGGALWMNAGTPEKGHHGHGLVVEVPRQKRPADGSPEGSPVQLPLRGLPRGDHHHRCAPRRAPVLPRRGAGEGGVVHGQAARPAQGLQRGSVFKNPPGSPAGYLIEQAG
jgi:UDP-N-acetylmuramate dehydrogenase